jgi:hypothetical protein
MKSRYRRKRNYRHRRSLSASNWGPVLALFGTVLGVLALVAFIVFIGLPKLLPMIGVDFAAPFAPTPSPSPTPGPTPTPNPMDAFDIPSAETEVVFDASSSYRWFGDPYMFEGKMVFSAGKLVDTKAELLDLYFYEPTTRTANKLNISLRNVHFMFPKFNGRWLVYLDAKLDGGGYLTALDLTGPGAEPIIIKEVYTNQPEPMLDGDYVAWTERTGTRMDKLFVCDLNTLETTVVHMFSNNSYGQSLPYLRDGLLIWADVDSSGASDSSDTSVIYSMRIGSPSIATYSAGVYVHDPQTNGTYTAWLDAHHAPDTCLYYSREGGKPVKIASGVVQFGMADTFIAYCKDEAIYAYRFDNGKTYQISADYESAQFLGVSDSCVIWMDVTSRERDIIKFSRLP